MHFHFATRFWLLTWDSASAGVTSSAKLASELHVKWCVLNTASAQCAKTSVQTRIGARTPLSWGGAQGVLEGQGWGDSYRVLTAQICIEIAEDDYVDRRDPASASSDFKAEWHILYTDAGSLQFVFTLCCYCSC